MDSVTQAALGAILGETLLARRLGNRAMLWGAAIGTLPDLDVLVFPWLDSIERLSWHRGLSHSLLFVAAATPALAWLLRRVHGDRLADCRARVAWFVFLDLLTHVLIDCFNVYGTQVLEPFAPWRAAFGNMFIVDPLFTAPMLLGLLLVVRCDPAGAFRRRVPRAGLLLATAYAALSLGLQQVANARFAASIARNGIPAQRWESGAAPFTTLYWRCLVDAGDDLWIGFVSVLDPPDRPIAWQRVPRNAHLLGDLADSRAVQAVRWFSKDYFTVERATDGSVTMVDLRFGDADIGLPDHLPRRWVFRFAIEADGDAVRRYSPELRELGPPLHHLWRRVRGLPDD